MTSFTFETALRRYLRRRNVNDTRERQRKSGIKDFYLKTLLSWMIVRHWNVFWKFTITCTRTKIDRNPISFCEPWYTNDHKFAVVRQLSRTYTILCSDLSCTNNVSFFRSIPTFLMEESGPPQSNWQENRIGKIQAALWDFLVPIEQCLYTVFHYIYHDPSKLPCSWLDTRPTGRRELFRLSKRAVGEGQGLHTSLSPNMKTFTTNVHKNIECCFSIAVRS